MSDSATCGRVDRALRNSSRGTKSKRLVSAATKPTLELLGSGKSTASAMKSPDRKVSRVSSRALSVRLTARRLPFTTRIAAPTQRSSRTTCCRALKEQRDADMDRDAKAFVGKAANQAELRRALMAG